jgi:hypothetical protein
MKRQEYRWITSLGLLCLVSLVQQTALAQDSQAGKQGEATHEGRIWRRGEPYNVPPLRIRLLDKSTREPRIRTAVRIRFVTQWSQTADPKDTSPNGYAEIRADAVTDDDGYFTTNGTTIVPEGFAPPGDNPLFVPRFVYVTVGYEISGGHGFSNIDPATIEAVRSGRLADLEIPCPETTPQPDESRTDVDVVVLPSADWTNSTVRVKRGDTIQVRATGTMSLGRQGSCGPDGIGAVDPDALIADKPLGALIAVIGDENDDFIFVGADTEFVAPHDGLLFFSINEGNLRDNSGTFSAHVRVRRQEPTGSSGNRPE